MARSSRSSIESDSSILAARLNRLRIERGWTLADLSKLTGLSKPYLSRLESGQRQPSLAALLALARTYETALQSLLDSGSLQGGSPVVIQGSRAQIRRGNGLRYRAISGGGALVNLNAAHVTVPHRRRQAALSRHDGEELLYVLSGTLNLGFDHESHTLHPGDSAHFDARIPHRLSATGPDDAQVLMVAYVPPGISASLDHPAPPESSRRGSATQTRAPARTNSAPPPICAALEDPSG
jgi:transcriptional regulator with XRE-family HTH domain